MQFRIIEELYSYTSLYTYSFVIIEKANTGRSYARFG